MNLAIEEAVVNVMNYAFPEGKRSTILLEVFADEQTITFELRDDGLPFDPTANEEVDVKRVVKNQTIGGLGIHLIPFEPLNCRLLTSAICSASHRSHISVVMYKPI